MFWIISLIVYLGCSGSTTAVILHVSGLSLRDLSERYHVTMASRESVRRCFHRFPEIFSVKKKFKNFVLLHPCLLGVWSLLAW
jgi:hypothetical protein